MAPVPFTELSLRELPAGGGIADRVSEIPEGQRPSGDGITLFIHGFNVDFADARTGYAKFSYLVPEHKKTDHFWWVYWPGDASRNQFASALRYPDTPGRATRCAQELGRHLTRIAQADKGRPPLKLRIVAHSMGCRLALELADRIANVSEIEIELIALMAAAVPIHKVVTTGLLDLEKIGGKLVLVFWSSADNVLRFAFKPGQALERPGLTNFFVGRGALGYLGFKLTQEQVDRGQVVVHQVHDAGHGDYWVSALVASEVALKLPGEWTPRPPRPITDRSTPGRMGRGRSGLTIWSEPEG